MRQNRYTGDRPTDVYPTDLDKAVKVSEWEKPRLFSKWFGAIGNL